MKITVDLAEKDLNDEIGEFVKGRVKNLIRNDSTLKELISEIIKVELEKQVRIATIFHVRKEEVEKIVRQELQSRISASMVSLVPLVRDELRNTLCKIVTGLTWEEVQDKKNMEVIKSLFSSEIEELKNNG